MERSRGGAFSETLPERNAAAEPQTEAAASAVERRSGPVTNGRKVQQNGRGRRGDRETTNGPVGETQRPLVTAMADRLGNVLSRMIEVGQQPVCSGEMRRLGPVAGSKQNASVCGWRAEVERRRRGAHSEARPERNGNAEPQTEANANAVSPEHPARDECEFSGAE